MKKILFLTNYPAPYRVEFFNELGKSCELTVLFEEEGKRQHHRDERWFKNECYNFACVFLKERYLFGIPISLQQFKYLRMDYDEIVICNISRINVQLAIFYCCFFSVPYVLEADGGFPDNSHTIKHLYKRLLIGRAKYCLASGQMTKEYFISSGAKDNKVFLYPFSSLRDDDISKKLLSKTEIAAMRKTLNINEYQVVLSVGQFIYRKGMDVLLESCKLINPNIGVYIVGAEAPKEYLEIKERMGLKNVHFLGFRTKEELSILYKVSDVFVLPTREDIWGLVINEAMAHGVPIVTTEKCIAGLELVKENKMGHIVPVENATALAAAVTSILENETIREEMRYNCIEHIKSFTIEKMAERHMEIFNNTAEETGE